LSGEHVYPVYPLAADAAMQLFVARAREADSRFVADDADTETIRRICERLDGLPLAIELAATRVRSLPARMLDDRVNMVRALALLAARAGAAGDAERAGRLWGAIETEEARGAIGRGEGHRKHRDRALADRGDALERAREAGRGMPLAEAVTYALVEEPADHEAPAVAQR
jgi:hypothetical protein